MNISEMKNACLERLTRHLKYNRQTYGQHLSDAWGFSLQCGIASIVFLVHGLFPFAFEHTGSNMVNIVHDTILDKRIQVSRLHRMEENESVD